MGTQGWTESQYGQYYLYSNVFDDTTGIFAGATDATNLGTIALLGGLGGGLGGYGSPTGYYPSYGAPAAAPATGRKRRGLDVEKEEYYLEDGSGCPRRGAEGDKNHGRKRRSDCRKGSDDPACRKRRDTECEGDENCARKRRETETEACAICKLNSDSLKCKECPE